MRLIIPWLAALAPAVAAFSSLNVSARKLVGRQSDAANATLDESPLEQATYQAPFGTNSNSTKLAFAITINPKNGDFRFRMAGPNIYSWIAFGTGEEMKDSMMFVMYRGAKNALILSPRMSTDNVEPSYVKGKLNFTAIQESPDDIKNGIGSDGMFYQTGLCKNCAKLAKIDINNAKQKFMFAVGPRGRDPYSDELNAPLRRHLYYGTFELDITRATGIGIPTFQFKTEQKNFDQTLKLDVDWKESAHSFFMVFTFVVLMPLAIFFVRTLEHVKIHMILQSIALFFVIIGFASGIAISMLYNRSHKFGTPHQIIGILVAVAILMQWTFGFLSHRQYNKTGRPISWAMKTHKLALGPIVFALGIVNISLGLTLALANKVNYLYLPVMFIIIVLLALTSWKKNWFMARWGRRNRTTPYNGGAYGQQTSGVMPGYGPPSVEPYQHTGSYATRSDIALGPMGDPPAYDSAPQKPREFT